MTVLRLPDGREGDGAPQTVASALRLELTRLWLVLADAAQRVRSGGDAEAIHDLRVAARRLAATLGLIRAALPVRSRRRLSRALRRLRRRLGRARELEVAVALLEERIVIPGGEARHPLERWVDGRRLRRNQATSLARRRVTRRALRRLALRVSEASGRIAEPEGDAGSLLTVAARRIAALRLEAHERLTAAAAAGNDGELHVARIALKRFRYAAEALGRAGSPIGGGDLRIWKDLQEVLGAMHDRALLRDLLLRRSRRWRVRARIENARAAEALAGTLEAERQAELERLRARLASSLETLSAPSA